MKKIYILLLLLATGFTNAQDLEWRIDRDYPNAWTVRGQWDGNCNAVKFALFDKDNKFLSSFTARLDFGTFEYTADPSQLRGAAYMRIKCY